MIAGIVGIGNVTLKIFLYFPVQGTSAILFRKFYFKSNHKILTMPLANRKGLSGAGCL
jgi:hypothetical protein